ncbi:MAG: OsmC family protein [bacterium]|nr:OsmC family protein [bacterium]
MGSFDAKMKWTGGFKFEGITAFGHKIVTDGAKKAGGEEAGYKPTELLLYGIAGCTGIDVVRVLEKMRQKVTSIDIEMTAHHNDEYPKPIHTIDIKYTFEGENLDPSKVEQAIKLSEEKYCMVSQTVQQPGEVKTSFEIL